MKTIELTGTVDEHGGIAPATPLPVEPATPPRIVVHFEQADEALSRKLKILELVISENAHVFRELAK